MYSDKVLQVLNALNIKSISKRDSIYKLAKNANKYLIVQYDNVDSTFNYVTTDKDTWNRTNDYQCISSVEYTYDEEYQIYNFTYDTISYDYEDQNKFIGSISKDDLIKNGIDVPW